MAGWFQIHREGDRTTIEINKSEIRSDARRAINRGSDFLDRREQQQFAQPQRYDDQNERFWPQEQVAVQQERWGEVQQQSYLTPRSDQQNWSQQDQRLHSEPGAQLNSYPQPQYYPPVTR